MSQHSDSLALSSAPVASFLLPLVFALPGVVILSFAVALNWGR